MTENYHIVIKEELDDRWADWFAGLMIIHSEGGGSVLIASVVDQAELHGLIMRVRDLGLTLISVNRVPSGNP